MAFFRGPQSPREEQYTSVFNSPQQQQRNPNRWSASMTGAPADVRGALHRRFTTTTVPTVNSIPGLSPIGQQRLAAAGETQQTTGLHHRYEALLLQQRQIQEELDRIDPETRREVDENLRHEQAVTNLVAQSEPSTPPDWHPAFSSFSRSSRFSAASLASPQWLLTRANRASTQLTSPSLSFIRSYGNGSNNTATLPSQSVPGSRRHSDDEDEDEHRFRFESGVQRAGFKNNRNSLPSAAHDRNKRHTADLSLPSVNGGSNYLFGNDEEPKMFPATTSQTSPPDTKTFLKVQHDADGFPKLIRSEQTFDAPATSPNTLLDTAAPTSPERQPLTRAQRHRISLPPASLGGSVAIAPMNSILASTADARQPHVARRSVDLKYSVDPKRPSFMTAPRAFANGQPISSFSTNDVPTLKSMHGDASDSAVSLHSPPAAVAAVTEPLALDRSTAHSRMNSASARQSQDLTSAAKVQQSQENIAPPPTLHGNAAPFGPLSPDMNGRPAAFPNPVTAYGQPFFNPYSMPMLGNAFQNMNIGVPNGFTAPPFPSMMPAGFPPHAGFNGFQPYPPPLPQHPPPQAMNQSRANAPPRRSTAEEAQQSFNSIKLEQIVGQIYTLCKDQHGCRFLQRKLDERNEQTVQIIFDDVKGHMVELMVDPFGNYLCQKLLESCNDDQRTVLVKNATPAMTKIALNQHGTRALQKMIEFISKPEQTALIIEALRDDVVALIQDLNGNHVIQKCLNHLSSENARFIFEAVGNNCVTVGTHRHGCCVLQRCIDHADGLQKGEMVDHVIANANALVQDPFGNYVVQYILDLAEPCFTEPLSRAFLPNIVYLSKQKFSSNVIEKCIRCAGPDTKRDIIREIMAPQAIERLLRDGFANYVVQTAMDFADDDAKPILIEHIRAILPTIRNTPHGRRIQSKITDYETRMASAGTSILSPLDSSRVVAAPATTQPSQTSNGAPRVHRQSFVGAPQQWPANNYGYSSHSANSSMSGTYKPMAGSGDIHAPTPQRGHPNFMVNNGQDYSAAAPTTFAGQPFNITGMAQPYGPF